MTRNKVKLEWISNDSSRKSSLKKRRAGIIKKTGELSTLSDVKMGAIIYSPGEANPMVSPSYEEMKNMLERFLSMSMVQRTQKMVTQETYLTQMVTKETAKKNKERKKNDRREAQEMMNRVFEGNDLYEMNIMQLNNLSLLAADKLKELDERARVRHQQDPHHLSLAHAPTLALFPVPAAAPLSPAPATAIMEVEEALLWAQDSGENVGSSIPESMQQLMDDQWFMETMALHKDMPPEYITGTSTNQNEKEVSENPSALFPNIFSP
ncbi:hypothetical protein U1Q18_013879 [Sarracenia purpurea var. burkii]